MVHVQAAHMVNIYEIGDFDGDSEANQNGKGSKLDKTNGECHNNTNGSSPSCNGVVVHPNENVSNSRRHERFIESEIICKVGFRRNQRENDDGI